MGSAPAAIDVVVLKVLGYKRVEHEGWAVLLDVEMGGTVQQVCRLVFATEAAIAGLRKFVAEVSTMPSLGAD